MRIAFAAAAATLALATTTAAADPKTASALYAQGQEAYQAQNYGVAAEKFIAAYGADPDPVYLFNAAQAFRFGNDCGKSAAYYRNFLDKVPNPPNADKIRVWYEDMKACDATRTSNGSSGSTTGTPPPTDPTIVAPTPPPESSGGLGTKKIAAFAAGGLGLVALGISLKYGLDGRDALKKRDAVCNGCEWNDGLQVDLDRYEQEGRDANTKAYGFLAVGGVLVAAGVGLFVWSLGDAKTEQRVALVPTLDGGYVVGTFAF